MRKLKKIKKGAAGKKLTRFRPMILSRHPSHRPFRRELPLFTKRSVIRFGSSTQLGDTVSKGGTRVEVNTVEAIRNSASKLLMKQCFRKANVSTADWIYSKSNDEVLAWAKDKYPVVKKNIYGSRGKGNTLLNSENDLKKSLSRGELQNYIFEKFYNYSREYRLHVTKDGCFYTCRKMLKNEAPQDKRWQRHDDNCVWILEENPLFDKPKTWDNIVKDCVNALLSVGLDFCACDVKVQSAKNKDGKPRKEIKHIVLETNSAPSMGDVTHEKYLETLPQIINAK